MNAVLALVALTLGHVPGISQGSVVVDEAPDATVVSVELVFARADAALLAPDAFGVEPRERCVRENVVGEDVENDGHAIRFDARCPAAADLDDDSVTVAFADPGLGSLGETHRLMLTVPASTGPATTTEPPRAVLRKAGDDPLTLRAPGQRPRSRLEVLATLTLVVGAVAVALGSRQPSVAAMNTGFVVVGALFGSAVAVRALHFSLSPSSLGIAVALVAVASWALDRAPRVRPVALVVGAMLALLLRPLLGL